MSPSARTRPCASLRCILRLTSASTRQALSCRLRNRTRMLVPPFPKQVTNNCYASSSSLRQRGVLTISLALVLIGATACSKSSSDPNVDSRGIIVVNAPATGEVRRILVGEGVAVGAGAPILEIAVQTEMPVATPTPGESAEARAARNLKSAD